MNSFPANRYTTRSQNGECSFPLQPSWGWQRVQLVLRPLVPLWPFSEEQVASIPSLHVNSASLHQFPHFFSSSFQVFSWYQLNFAHCSGRSSDGGSSSQCCSLVFYGNCTCWAEWDGTYLSDKRWIVAMFEVLGQYLLGECVLIDHDKADAVECPFDNMLVLVILNGG